jgi:hypothetical protein
MTQEPDQDQRTDTASSSVRVAILVFLGSFVLLFVMGVIWLFIRVEPADSAHLDKRLDLSVFVPGKDFGLSQRGVLVLDDDGRAFFR